MVNGRKALACKLSISCGFIPAHTPYRKVVLPSGIVARFPCRWPRSTSGIAELSHGSFPRNHPPIPEKRMLPVFTSFIAAAIDKLSKLLVGDFISVHPVVVQLNPSNV